MSAAQPLVDEATLSLVRQHMLAVRLPAHHDKVYKEECMFSFDTPESPGGLYINLTTFQGFGADFVGIDYARNQTALYLHEKWTPASPSDAPDAMDTEQPQPGAQLSSGEQGGLRLALGGKPRPPPLKTQSLVVMGPDGPCAVVPLPCPDLPERVLQAIAAINAHESVSITEAAAVWEEERRVSRYAADLPQLPADGKRISPNPMDWRCEETGVTDNLWLNLSTGFIGSGRQNWDGSGGNGSALRHFEATGRRYPLVVKLGTITPRGADVFSYAPDEDDMVLDPHLDAHLAHWGINMMQMEKSEKTMAELQMELNATYDFSRITEEGGALRRVSGPGLTGLINLGNSCYMNSVLQVLWLLPSLAARYVDAAPSIQRSAPTNPADDLPAQLSKIGVALLKGRTGRTAPPPDVAAGGSAAEEPDPAAVAVRPLAFKSLVGRGHPEFSSARQQDAVEFWVHLLELVSRAEHAAGARLGVDPSSLDLAAAPTRAAFTFQLEDRVQCAETGAVRYRGHEEQWLGLNIPLDAATNKEAVEAYKEREARRARLRAEGATDYISADGPGGAEVAAAGSQGGAVEVVSHSEQEAPVVPQVPFAACLAAWAADEPLADVWSAAAGRRGPALKRSRFATFPPYLLLALKRYYTSENWVPKKLEVEVEMPDRLSLEALRGSGLQPGEALQPETDEAPRGSGGPGSAAPVPAQLQAPPGPDPAIVEALVGMGFSEGAAGRAALAVGAGGGVEAAMEWVLAHLDDPGINAALPPPDHPDPAPARGGGGGGGAGSSAAPSAESLSALTAMGFTDDQATAALKACSGSVERAADWLFSHMDDLDSAVAAQLQDVPQGGAASSGKQLLDGPGEYQLAAIISHMGANTGCGHYVAHVKKGSRWYIFNDEKVAESEHPPRALGYLYLYRRTQEVSGPEAPGSLV